MKIELSDQEVQVLVSLMDAGVKAVGLAAAKNAAALLIKLEAAAKESQSEEPESNVLNFESEKSASEIE